MMLFRISYCTADKMHDKVFAYIAQNQHSESLECHAFLCTKRKVVSGRARPRGDSNREVKTGENPHKWIASSCERPEGTARAGVRRRLTGLLWPVTGYTPWKYLGIFLSVT